MRLIVLLILLLPFFASAQSADGTFHLASNQYIHKKMQEAKRTIDEGLKRFPNDPKLSALRNKIKDEEQQQQEQDQKQDQQNEDEKKDQKDKDKKDQEKKDQEKKDEEKKDQKQEQDKNQKDDQKKDDQKKQPQNLDPKKLPRISEEKARMILEAMKNQEKQYLQQQKRKATKSRDKTKPDW
jgi:hypothetical protein